MKTLKFKSVAAGIATGLVMVCFTVNTQANPFRVSQADTSKMAMNKMSHDKMSKDKMSKMSHDKMSHDKMSKDKMNKMSHDKMGKKDPASKM